MVRVVRSTIVDATPDNVWAVIRAFGEVSHWHSAYAETTIERGAGGDVIGAVRKVKLADGGEFSEQLLTLSDVDLSLTTCLRETTVPLFNYIAHTRLGYITDGQRTFWECDCRFDTPAARQEELTTLVSQTLLEAGFVAMRQRLGLEV
ncbi:SRPBCC family protein [Agrobacterium sp. NPDC058088]|uniref:SRPBCC family protein n=1 Tax=Agrobacterium sp. NPDC058088 TaxID=3346335 RepID=UPI0036DF97AC